MQFVTFESKQGPVPGAVMGGGKMVMDLSALGIADDMLRLVENFEALLPRIKQAASNGKHHVALEDVRLLAPIPIPARNIFCVGKNYLDHAREFGTSGFDSSASTGDHAPDEPIIFSKVPSSVIGPHDEIPRSLDPYDSVDYEAELAVIVGKRGRVTDGDDPMDYVFGYTILNDVTSRELQRRHKQWLLGKGLDGFCPLGPVIVTRDEFEQQQDASIKTWVNGEPRQSATLAQLIFDVPMLLRTIGRVITLQAGDIIATGTPAGVGIGFDPPKYLRKGDVVRIEISGIGVLENPVG